MEKSKRNRYFIIIIFYLAAISLILISALVKDASHFIEILFFSLAGLTIVGTLLDSRIDKKLRIGLLSIGGFFLVGGILCLILKNPGYVNVSTLCIIFGVLEILSGLIKVVETIMLAKEHNFMAHLFTVEVVFEITLGILMIIERESGIRLHLNLIAAEKLYEGTIKFFNEFVEERRRK